MALLRLPAVSVSFAILQVLAGCSGLRLYDSERNQQGEAARKAWSEVDLKAMIDGARGNLKKLLAAELDTQQKLATAIRDHELRSMVQRDVSTGLVEPVEKRLTDLAGALELPTAQANVGRKASVKSALGVLRTECDKKLLEEGVYASKEGAIHAAWDEYNREAAALAVRKKDLKGLQGAYDAARAEYDKAVADGVDGFNRVNGTA